MQLNDVVSQSVCFLQQVTGGSPAPRVAIILGSGLGELAGQIEEAVSIEYAAIPGFACSTARGHRGELVFGRLESVPVVAMVGRFHRYEGWTNDQTSFPVRVMNALGADVLIVSNAAGGVCPRLKVGDLVLIRDHINAMSSISRTGAFAFNLDAQPLAMGSKYRTKTYDLDLQRVVISAAMESGFSVTVGTYLATLGPTYETRSEYRMMRKMGADVVGMSTVPEVIVASSLGMKVLGISMVSNTADPDRPQVASHDEVLAAGRQAAAKMEAIVRSVLQSIAD